MKNFFIFFILFVFLSCSKSEVKNNSSQKFVVTSPELAELLYLIDAAKNVVGVTIECNYPAFYKKVEKVGNFGNVNIEKIIKLDPTFVFTTKLEQDKLNDTLKKLNIKTISVYPKNLEEWILAIRLLGKVTSKEKRANFVADSLKNELKKYNYQKSTIKPKVYVEIYNNPLMSVSDSSFIGQLISFAGGRNIFNKLPRDYSQISQESVVKKNPDIIISLVPGETKKQIAQRKGWQNIKAIKKGKIYTTEDIDPDILLRAGSRVIDAIKKLHSIFNNYEKID